MRPSGCPPEIEVALDERLQAEVVRQRSRQQEPRIGHQPIVVKGRLEAIGAVR